MDYAQARYVAQTLRYNTAGVDQVVSVVIGNQRRRRPGGTRELDAGQPRCTSPAAPSSARHLLRLALRARGPEGASVSVSGLDAVDAGQPVELAVKREDGRQAKLPG